MKYRLLGILTALALVLGAPATQAAALDDMIGAIKRDDATTVSNLLALGVSADTVDEQGNSLLLIAAREGGLSALRVLLDGKARVATVNAAGEDALMHAAIKGHMEIAGLLLAAGAPPNRSGWSPLIYAAVRGDVRIGQLLVARGAQVNAGAANGFTALMMAVREGHVAFVKWLLEQRADPNLETDAGLTAMSIARQTGRAEIQELLVKAGAK